MLTEICMFKDGKDPSQQKDHTHNRKKTLGIVNECMPWQKDITSVLPTSVSELCMILQERTLNYEQLEAKIIRKCIEMQ